MLTPRQKGKIKNCFYWALFLSFLFGLSWWCCSDEDGDGYVRFLSFGPDCKDGSTWQNVNPGAKEVCNDRDDNCNGQIDEGEGAQKKTYYHDFDGDGYGDDKEKGYDRCPKRASDEDVLKKGDCNDRDRIGGKKIYPGAPEVCDGVDNDCNGQTDESGTRFACSFEDHDLDGFKKSYCLKVGSCTELPKGKQWEDRIHVGRWDCDDEIRAVHPGSVEVCDEIDNDCDGEIDEGVQKTFYFDFDGDGFGDDNAGRTDACTAPEGYVVKTGDCDDTNSQIHTGCPAQPAVKE